MATDKNDHDEPKRESKSSGDKSQPDWSNGLRELYDSVVDEPLPDSFKDLLEQLDETSDDDGGES